MNVTIVSLSQDFDLENGSMANFMVVRLSNGKVIRALIQDDAASEIIQLGVGTGSAPPYVSIPDEGSGDTNGAQVFGDGEFHGGLPEAVPLPPDAPAPAPVAPPQRRRPKSVQKDEMGYPVTHYDGAIDPRDVTGTRDRDEDGVGQI